jgi:serine/threonine-protein kinase
VADLLDRLKSALSGRYAITRELGRGGMATVYLAEDLRHRRSVAVKVLEPDLAHAIGSSRFLREIEIAARLSHPNILPLHDSGEADGLLYYVMPFVEGETLRDWLNREKQLPLEDALRIVHEVADALSYAHNHGVVHRDIKPENILLAEGHAVVSDFGIARAIDAAGSERLTGTGLAVGTPAYMSPEQATGERGVDARSDIYALGCVLYELLAGEPPYAGPTPHVVIAKLLADPVPSVRRLRETVPAGIDEALVKALAKTPADRFTTAAAFSSALDRAASRPSVESPPTMLFGMRLTPRGRRAAALSVVLAVLLSGGAWLVIRTGLFGGPQLDSIAVLPFENLSRDAEQEDFVDGMHDALISRLAQIGALRVISRTSTLRFRNTTKSISEIADELDVSAVVEGSVLKAGDSVRIQVQLIQARPREQHLWAQTFDRPNRAVFTLQGDVADSIARQIGVRLTSGEQARLAVSRDVDPLAHEALLRGRRAQQKNTAAGFDEALRHYESAVRQDPNYAAAHMAIGGVWEARAGLGMLPTEEAFQRAEPALRRALELDSTTVQVRLVLARVRIWQWDWTGAEREYRRVLETDPNDANTLSDYAMLLVAVGRPAEATALMERAVKRDPLNTGTMLQSAVLSEFVGRYDEAQAQFRALLQIQPRNRQARWGLWAIFHEQRRYAEAYGEVKSYFGVLDDRRTIAALERGYAEGGYKVALRRAAEELAERSKTLSIRSYTVAMLYARADERELALDWLERSFDARDVNVRYARVVESFSGLRGHPRFEALLRRMNLGPGGS